MNGRISIGAPLTHTLPLAAIDAAFGLRQAGEPVRSVVRY
jgi:Zn-dependent alcohol dehydrogenase